MVSTSWFKVGKEIAHYIEIICDYVIYGKKFTKKLSLCQ